MKRSLGPIAVAIVVAVPAAIAISYCLDWFRSSEPDADWAAPTRMVMTPMPDPAITRPATLPSTEASLGGRDDVIGIGVNGKYRAYCIKAMSSPTTHIIND